MTTASFTYFQSFLEFPNVALKLTMAAPLTCTAVNTSAAIQITGITTKTKIVAAFKRLWFIFGLTNLVYQNVGMLVHMLAMRNTKSTIESVVQISETGSIMGLTLIGSVKVWIFYRYSDTIANLIREFEQIFEKRYMLADLSVLRVTYFLKRSRLLMKRTIIFFLASFCYYNSLPIVEMIYEFLSSDCRLTYRYQSNTWYPWTSSKHRILSFLCSFVCQLQSSLTGVAFIMAGEFLLCFFITQLQMHLDFVACALQRLDASQPDALAKLKRIIRYHKYLLSLSDRINDLFNVSFMMNFITATIAICLMGFSMLMISLAAACKYSVGLLAFLIFTLFICYNGEEFAQAHDQILNSAFHGNWFDGDKTYRKMILFFMTNAKKPRQLQVYKFTNVSMRTFMMILNISYKLFTFFKAMA